MGRADRDRRACVTLDRPACRTARGQRTANEEVVDGMLGEMDGSATIAWTAEAFASIRVYAPKRGPDELTAFARRVGDLALVNRTVRDLRTALRAEFDGIFDLEERDARAGSSAGYVVITLHLPRGVPNPD